MRARAVRLPLLRAGGSLPRIRLGGADRPWRRYATTAPRGTFRSFVALLLVAGLLAAAPVLADTEGELQSAKARLAAAQARLNQATATWQEAEAALDRTRGELAATRAAIGRLEARVEDIEERLAARAREAFENGPGGTIDLLLSSRSFAEFSDRLEFLGNMAASDSSLVVEKEVAEEELHREQQDLTRLEAKQAADAARFEAQRQAVMASVGDYQDLVEELTARYRAELRAEKALLLIGQTPRPGAPIEVCPVAGPNSFVDSFGWPRSGGRTHQGIDLIAPFGTPVVAAHPGVVSRSYNALGGISAYVRASDGTFTYYAHMSSYSSASASVSSGTAIGYVGSTGNAGSTNHLHFEYHPGGGSAVDPYQLLLAVC